MFFKKFHSSPSTAKKDTTSTNIQRVTSTESNDHSEGDDIDPKTSSGPTPTADASQEYEAFLKKAKLDAELKEKEMLRKVREAEKRRRDFNLDPWASRAM